MEAKYQHHKNSQIKSCIDLQDLTMQPIEVIAQNHLLRYQPTTFFLTTFKLKNINASDTYRHLTKYDIPWNYSYLKELEKRHTNGEKFTLRTPIDTMTTQNLIHDFHFFDYIEIQNHFEKKQTPSFSFLSLLKAMRLHQWSKNILLFLPLLFHIKDAKTLPFLSTVLCFFAISFCASGVYLLNDWMDIYDDRKHPDKRKRPMASGSLNPFLGLYASPVLISLGATLATLHSIVSFYILLSYVVMTSCYTFYLKKIPFIDISTLCSLYLLRIALGSHVLGLSISNLGWLSAGCGFYSLAFSKRYTELHSCHSTTRRGYTLEDQSWIGVFGIILSLFSIHFLISALLKQTIISVLHCLAVFFFGGWYARIWVLTFRLKMPHDPVSFAIRDPISLALVLASTTLILSRQIFI
ncbi:MAG: UbiA family prenyltransferase [Oligoflexales bacterium]